MTLIVDASVALKWLIEEEGSEKAASLRSEELHAPALIRLEIGNALRSLTARDLLTAEAAREAYTVFLAAPMTLHPLNAADGAEAFALALQLAHPIYDCVYLALALKLEARYITADQRFQRIVDAAGGFSSTVVAL